MEGGEDTKPEICQKQTFFYFLNRKLFMLCKQLDLCRINIHVIYIISLQFYLFCHLIVVLSLWVLDTTLRTSCLTTRQRFNLQMLITAPKSC